MSTSSQIRNANNGQSATIVMQRVIAVIALGIAFVVMGSIFIPRGSTADSGSNGNAPGIQRPNNSLKNNNTNEPAIPGIPGTLLAPGEDDWDSNVEFAPPVEAWGDATFSSTISAHEGLPLLGSLQNDNYRTLIYGTDSGPRYTVFTKGQKEPLAVLLDLQTLAMYFRDVPMPDLASADTKQLMMATPDDAAPHQ